MLLPYLHCTKGFKANGRKMDHEFHRIDRLPPYVFERVNKLKAQARADGKDIIDFGMGNPDLPTPEHIVEKLVETVRNPRTHRYSASKGIPGLRKAQARYYERRFGVKLNPDTEVIATLGSKEGFANMAQAISNPGDVILVPNPTYPIHAFGFIISGATIRHLPVQEGDDFFAVLDQAVVHSHPKPKVLVLNYPGNPTAEVVDLAFYQEVVAYAKKHDIILLSDLAYSEIYFDEDNPPPSILQVEGAKDIAVEFTSLSKTFSMPGWRMGFAVGNERLIGALTRIKSYLDYGAFSRRRPLPYKMPNPPLPPSDWRGNSAPAPSVSDGCWQQRGLERQKNHRPLPVADAEWLHRR